MIINQIKNMYRLKNLYLFFSYQIHMNIIDYVSKNNLTMKDSPLNEVDSLVLSGLSYLYYEKVAHLVR